jgi:hypothetical protein
MISPKRMVEIFRRRGGGEFADLPEKLTPEQFAYLERVAEGEPIISRLYSKDEWFAVTKSRLVFRSARGTRAVSLDEIYGASTPRVDFRNVEELRKIERIKTDGGDLEVQLRDGRSLRVKVEPGGPYFGLMNVFKRVATINRRRNQRKASGNIDRPKTNDERPTTQL